MNPDLWKQAKDLIEAALDLPPDARPAFLLEQCEDPNLRADIQSLLLRAGDSLVEQRLGPIPALPSDRSTPATPSTGNAVSSTGGPIRVLPPRFVVDRKLGSGSFGDVYKVFDEGNQRELALKVLRNATPSALFHFKTEFRTLAEIRHRNLVRLDELVQATGEWMFTMEFVRGQHFDTFSPDFDTLRNVLSQVIEGVMVLHANGFLHRDIKPSNVLVTPEARVVIVDFGLISPLQGPTQGSVSMAGTPVYMAPEQTTRAALTEAADWYAVGVMLYKVLTGRVPFEGDLLSLLQNKRSKDPVPPSQLVATVPADLNDVCVGLLRRDPLARMSGREVLDRLKAGPIDRPLSPRPQEHAAAGSLFVGRVQELARARDAFARARAGVPQVLHVTGSSGIGKTAFIRRFLNEMKATQQDVIVLSGRCHQTESVPYEGIDEIVDALSRRVRRMSREEIGWILPRNFPLLARIFPVLGQIDSPTRPELRAVADPSELRTRVFLALREMLGRLAERHCLVLSIDDLQWADLDAFALIRELTSPPLVPPLLLVVAYRSEDIESTPALRGFRDTQPAAGYPETNTIELTGLDSNETTTLIESLLGSHTSVPEGLVSVIVGEAAGSPFFAQELVQGLAINRQGAHSGVSVQQAVTQRLNTLDSAHRDYVELVAMAGRPTPVEVIDSAASQGSTAVIRGDLVAMRLLRVVGSRDAQTVETYHDRIRHVVLSCLGLPSIHAGHSRLAKAFEGGVGDDPERLAFHLELAGDVSGAAINALKAARRAATALAFNKASGFYRQALSLGLSATDRGAAYGELAEALSNGGRGFEAAEAFQQAANLCSGAEQLQLRNRAAAQYLRSGHLREGVQLLDQLLGTVNIKVPETRLFLLARILLERTLLRIAKQMSARGKATAGDYAEIDACAAAAMGFSMVDPVKSALFSTRFVRLATQLGERRRLCFALAGEATQLCHTTGGGAPDRVARLLTQAGALAEGIGDAHARAFVKVMSSTVAYLQGHWKAACEYSDAAVEMLQTSCTGVAWELCTAHTIGFVARCARGEWAASEARLPTLLREAEARDDRYAYHSLRVLGCGYVLDLAADDPEKARRDLAADMAAWSYKYYDLQRANALLAEVDIALYENDAERAADAIHSGWDLIARSKLLRVPTTFTFSHAARGRVALALARRAAPGTKARRALLQKSHECARLILRKGPPWAHGVALLLLAGAASFELGGPTASKHLAAAEAKLVAADLIPYVMAARWRLKAMNLERPDVPDASVADWTSQQNIRLPEKVFRALAPGAWS